MDNTLDRVPLSDEIAEVLEKLKNGKTQGSSNTLSEILKVGCKNEDFRVMIEGLVRPVWEERHVPQE